MKAKDLISILQTNPEAEVLLHEYYIGEFDDTGTNTYSSPTLYKLPDPNKENISWTKKGGGNYIVLSGGEQVLFSWDIEGIEEEYCEDCDKQLEHCVCDFSGLE